MPYGPGTYGGGAPSPSPMGIPASVLPEPSLDSGALSELVQQLKGGQVGAEKMLELLSLLAAQAVPQMDQAPAARPTDPMDLAGLLGG